MSSGIDWHAYRTCGSYYCVKVISHKTTYNKPEIGPGAILRSQGDWESKDRSRSYSQIPTVSRFTPLWGGEKGGIKKG